MTSEHCVVRKHSFHLLTYTSAYPTCLVLGFCISVVLAAFNNAGRVRFRRAHAESLEVFLRGSFTVVRLHCNTHTIIVGEPTFQGPSRCTGETFIQRQYKHSYIKT